MRERVEILGARSLNGLPPCDFVARTVVTSTAALGANPPVRQTMSQNFWRPEVAGEAGFGDDVVGQLERDAVGEDRVVGVRDVAERPGVHERRLALERLHEVRLDRVLHDDGHRAAGLEHVGRDGLAVVGRGDDDAAEPAAQILRGRSPARTPPSPPTRP